MASYVRFLEKEGARVVPIFANEPDEETKDKLSYLNGVLMPGGSGDYLAKGKFVFDWITKQNDIGNFYPIWGTCLGFENLAIYTGG